MSRAHLCNRESKLFNLEFRKIINSILERILRTPMDFSSRNTLKSVEKVNYFQDLY